MNRIVVVEDEADLRVTYERFLRRAGYRVSGTGSREEGAKLVGSTPHPSLVILDLRLPDGDGLDLIRTARALDPPVPVIVVTAFPTKAAREAALAAGAGAFVAKPFAADALLSLVRGSLEHATN